MSQRVNDRDGVATQHDVRGRRRRRAVTSRPGIPVRLRLAQVAILALPVVVVVGAAWTRRNLGDDGFINLRVVSQILQGHGPVFNQGQRVEAFTSPLWIAVLTVADVLPVRLEWLAVGLGIALLGTGVALATAGAVRLHPSTDRWRVFVPAGSAVVMALAPLWSNAANGQETGLSYAWLGAACLALAWWARGRQRIGWFSAAVIGLGPLVRPDLAVFTFLFLVVVLAGGVEERWRDRVRALLWALAVPIAYEVFRMGYYGLMIPNTALAKSAGGSRWGAGWNYLRDTIDPYWLWLPLLIVAVGCAVPAMLEAARTQKPAVGRPWPAEHRRFLVFGAFGTGSLLTLGYMVKIGGDYVHSRLLLPGLFGLLAPFAAVPLRRAYAGALAVLPWAFFCTLWFRSPADGHVPFEGPKNAVTLEDFGWQRGGPKLRWFAGNGIYVKDKKIPPAARQPRPIVVSFGIGVVSYSLGPDVDVFDVLGLAEPIASHEELRRRGFPGHEKLLPAPWIAALVTDPNSSVNPADFPTAPPPLNLGFKTARLVDQDDPRGRSFADRVATARYVWRCPRMRAFVSSYSAPLGPGRFFDNLWHSFDNTTLQIPPEPADAQRSLCR